MSTQAAPEGALVHQIKSLLMATDLSPRSDRPLERALELSSRHGVPLTVLHVVDEHLPGMVRDGVVDAAREEIEACVKKLGGGANIPVNIDIASGNDHEDILLAVDSQSTDIVVMGVHRNETGMVPISGTTMERVIRQGTQPVLVVSNQVRGPYKRVVVGIDFSVYSRFAIRSAIALAPDAEFHFIHAFHVPFEGFIRDAGSRRAAKEAQEAKMAQMIEEEMDALLGSSLGPEMTGHKIHKIARQGDVHEVLQGEVERIKPDLLVLGTHGRAGIAHMVLGSVAANFLNKPPCDVLAVKAW